MKRVLSIALAGLLLVGAAVAVAAVRDGDGRQLTTSAAVIALDPPVLTPVGRGARDQPAGDPEAASTMYRPARREQRRRAGPNPATCPATRHGAVLDRANQQAWLCRHGRVQRVFPVTTAISQPEPGTYTVYAKDMQTTSGFGGRPTQLDRFVAFTHGRFTGARIAFHAIPRYFDGTLAQTPESVGDPDLLGVSAGCIRVRPEDAVMIWDSLAIGDEVRVIS
jgi:hypothetical protein